MRYTDVDIWEKSCGIMFLEEKLHLVSLMIPHFDTKRALEFVICIKYLINFSLDGEEVSPFGKLSSEWNPFET